MARWVQDEWGGHWETDTQYNETNPGKTDASGNPTGVKQPSGWAEGGVNNPFWQGDIGKYAGIADDYRSKGPVRMNMGMVNADRAQGEQSRNEMLGALSMLSQRAQTGDTPATQQLRQAQAQNMASLRGGAMSARGGGAARAAAAQAARSTGARSGQSNAVGMSALQAAEMDRARQQYMQQATALRAADLQRRGMSAEEAFRQANLSQESYGLGQRAALGYEGLRGQTEDYANELRLSKHRRDLGQAGRNAQSELAGQNAALQGGLAAASMVGASGSNLLQEYLNDNKGKF